MTLKITDCNDINFIIYLIKIIKDYLLKNTKKNKLHYLNDYLKTLDVFKKVKIQLLAWAIIITAANSLTYKKFKDTYIITINNNKKIFGTNAKLFDICNLINYGSLSVQGYPIFTEAFNYVANNIEVLYADYM